MKKLHYAGGVRVGNVEWYRGWPCCCSGDKAYKIRQEGNQVYETSDVTCARCKDTLQKGTPKP